MIFQWPLMLWSLLLLPILVLLYVLAQRRRKKFAVQFPNLSLIRQAMGKGPGFRRHLPAILLLGALAILCIALSRPTGTIPLVSNQGLIVLALDSSGSMRAQDVDPSRIEAAKAAATAFVDKQPGGARMAVVTFAATASLVQPPTDDKEALHAAIDRLILQRGTAIGSGIIMSMNTILEDVGEAPIPFNFGNPWEQESGSGFGRDREGSFRPSYPAEVPPMPPNTGAALNADVIVLMSDGQSNVGPDPLEVVSLAAQRKVRIYTVGLGDPNGVILRAYNRSARVSLDEATLRSVAEKTKGDYFRASTNTDLRAIYENLSTDLVIKQEKVEITALLAGLAIVLLMVGSGLSVIWFGRSLV